MKFYSTNNKSPLTSFESALFSGLAPDDGLYMPLKLPKLPLDFFDWINCKKPTFQEIASRLTKIILSYDVNNKALKEIVYDTLNFNAPLVKIRDNLFVLELFHGPTLSFKDFGSRFLARISAYFLKKRSKKITIVVATSGDTGSAVAHGFYNIPNLEVYILYPSKRISQLQEKQITTFGKNIHAIEVNGSFDDCQRLAKLALSDDELRKELNISSANSINVGRLLPQMFYYFHGYQQLRKLGVKKFTYCVPSGNFGNLTAGLIAKRMGLPVSQFIAATNANDIVPNYLKTGTFRPRKSKHTMSNAMDVGNPSNFTRIMAYIKID